MPNENQQQQQKPTSIVDLLFNNIKVDDTIQKWNQIKTARLPWESKWQLIQDQVFPNYRDYMGAAFPQPNQPQTDRIKNHSCAVSGKINKIVAQLNAQLTDPAVKWLDLKFGNKFLGSQKPISDWLYAGIEALYDLFADPESNFYPSTYSFHFDWFTIGTACREIILRKDTGKIQFNTISMQDIYIELSGYGDIDTVYRRFMVTPKQAYDLWGEKIHESQKRLLQQESSITSSHLHEYIEVSTANPLKDSIPSPAFMTYVVDKTNKCVVDLALHKQQPYIVARFDVASSEIYGRTYVWDAMPDIMIINRLSKRAAQSADYAIFPPMLVKDAAAVVQSQITPNSFIQGLDASGRPTIQPMNMGMNFPFTIEYYDRKLNDLDEALVARDIFSPEMGGMTATEVNERKIQASNRLRPILVRLEHEDLNKTIIRAFSLLMEIGVIPPFPYEALGIPPEAFPDPLSQLRVHFSGQMAKMQRLQDVQNNDTLFTKTMQAAQVDPSILDRINLDAMLMEDAKIYGINPNIINSDEVVQMMRQNKQMQQMQEQVIQQKLQEKQEKIQKKQQELQEQSIMVDNIVKLKEAGLYVQPNK